MLEVRLLTEEGVEQHPVENLKTLLGRGDGSVRPGRHVVYLETPMTNLYLTLLDRMAVNAERIGDSTGKADHLTDV